MYVFRGVKFLELGEDLVLEEQKNLDKQEYDKLPLSATLEGTYKNHGIQVPSQLIDIVARSIQQQPDIIDTLQKSQKVGEKLYEVIISSDLQQGIDNGKYTWNGFSTLIRNKKTGYIVGRVQIQKPKLPNNKIDAKSISSSSILSNITKSICSISGQIQLAEISKGIDILKEKADQIISILWREKITELKGIGEVIETALSLLPNEKALHRLNDLIFPLECLAGFFHSTMEDILSKKISLSFWQYFLEGLKVWKFRNKDRNEYNDEFIGKIKDFLGEFGFMIECYSQTMGMLGTCYQIVHDYNTAKPRYDKMHNDIEHFSSKAFNKLEYLLDISEVDSEEKKSLSNIVGLIKNRNIPLNEDISENIKKIGRASEMYEHLKNQFSNSEIEVTVDVQILLGGGTNND